MARRPWGQSGAGLRKLTRRGFGVPAGSISHLSFAEDTSADEDDQTLSQGRHKKKGNKLLEKTEMERGRGEPPSPQPARAGVKGGRRGDCLCHPPGSSQSGSRCSEGLAETEGLSECFAVSCGTTLSLPKVKAFTDS